MEIIAPYTVIELTKPNGKIRRVFSPKGDFKKRLSSIAPAIARVAEQFDEHGTQHAFTAGRSPITNARVHIGFQWTLSMDMSEWFDSVKRKHLEPFCECHAGGMLLKDRHGLMVCEISDCFIDGAARQGLPTSPAICNLAAVPMDNDILAMRKRGRFPDYCFEFSRYADDLTISSNSWPVIQMLLERVPQIVERHGFRINAAKTKVQCAKAGRRMITGVAVGETDIYVPRETRRRIRAGLHQTRAGLRRRNIRRMLFKSPSWRRRLPLTVRLRLSVRGLQEWAKLKLPKEVREHKPNPVSAAVKHAAAVVCHSAPVQYMIGFYRRKFG